MQTILVGLRPFHLFSFLCLNRISLHSDLIRNRNSGTGVNFELIMQTDFILFIRDCYDCIRLNEYMYKWYPYTLLYKNSSTAFEIFARAESKNYFDKIKTILDINEPSDLPLGFLVLLSSCGFS